MENFRETKESIGENRRKLLELEQTGKYVFHGSPENIKKLEPRQAYNYNHDTETMEPHGEPAVCATYFADVAIFRALVNPKDVFGESNSRFGTEGNSLHFGATQNLLDAAKRKSGKVYVLDKEKFKSFEVMECRSLDEITPLQVINVDFNDLPPNIQVLEE